MKDHSASDSSPLIGTNTYSPSVPISVYRELAAEMQATQAMLDSLNAQYQELAGQNQELVLQNQQLRREIDGIVQTVLRMQKLSSNGGAAGQNQNGFQVNSAGTQSHSSLNNGSGAIASQGNTLSEHQFVPYTPENLVTEQAEERYRPQQRSKRAMDVGGWWPILVIILVIAAAFGTGYFFVRPLLFKR